MTDLERLREALREIRKAAGSGKDFTNRMQFIHARAGNAILGLPWDNDMRKEYGYQIRDRTLIENDALLARLAELERVLREAYDESQGEGHHMLGLGWADRVAEILTAPDTAAGSQSCTHSPERTNSAR